MSIDPAALPVEVREATITQRVPEELAADEHGFMGGWWSVRVCADVGTMLMAHLDGDESLLRCYERVDFYAPVYAGEFLRFKGEIVSIGNTSRAIEVVADRVIARVGGSAAEPVEPPERVFSARLVCVTPSDRQRRKHAVSE